MMINSPKELLEYFRSDINNLQQPLPSSEESNNNNNNNNRRTSTSTTSSMPFDDETKTTTTTKQQQDDDNNNNIQIILLAYWSCILGYIEAISTHKQRRYQIFPIPIYALKRLVVDEFLPFLDSIEIIVNNNNNNKNDNNEDDGDSANHHREVVRSIANAVWSKTIPKPNIRDEIHANSLYVCLRGNIDRKSIDCFGAAVVTIIGCLLKGLESCRLTLSEDHAYERHTTTTNSNNDGGGGVVIGTCEVAIPGTTKLVQSKRGRDISATFNNNNNNNNDNPSSSSSSSSSNKKSSSSNNNNTLTPETSWLYMATNPVVCDPIPMTLVAIVANINCTIEKTQRGCYSSRQLYEIKRDLLWELNDQGYMERFPFGLMELGDCEEHVGSHRGSSTWVTIPDIEEPILMNEKLFLDAIKINKDIYNDSQVYPYFYAGHYHKDAGNEGPEHEYRLVHAMMYYADAARVASKYKYEGTDSLQLNKHISSVAMLIGEDILSPKYQNNHNTTTKKKEPRVWNERRNAIAVCTWLIGFFDSLLYWEENSGSKQFCEILSPSHKFSIGKLFQFFPVDIRKDAIITVVSVRSSSSSSSNELIGNNNNPEPPPPPPAGGGGGGSRRRLPQFQNTRSKRLSSTNSLLLKALQKPKVSVKELELAIPTDDDVEGTGRRSSKRARRTL